MITCTNIRRYDGLDFETYRQLPGASFSYLKREHGGIAAPIAVTTKMSLGTMVDALLTDGIVDISSPQYPAAKEIAHSLRLNFGGVLPHLAKQVSYTAIFEHKGFQLAVKGRPDFLMQRMFIIDLKICHAKNINGTIEFMRYEDQLFGYGTMAQVKDAYLLMYCKPTKMPHVIHIPVTDGNLFWENKILEHGSLIAA